MMMMKLRTPSTSRIFRVLLYSTRTLTLTPNHNSTTSPAVSERTTLFHRLSPSRNPSIIPLLDQWVEEGRPMDQDELHKIIKQFRKIGRHHHALQICQWMNDKPYLDESYKDVSIQLGLISKVQGLKKAEEYFNKIPNSMKVLQVYGALLSCYADAKSLEKAEATMQKMRELGYSKSLAYNCILGMYSAMEKYEKIDLLMEEMEKKSIPFDKFTYNIILNAYANTSQIHKMEKLLSKMEVDAQVRMEWHSYTVAAKGYLKVDEQEKAFANLKKAEYLIRVSKKKPAYEVLLTLYASLGRKDDVFRIWNLYKKIGKFYHQGYLCMMSSLAKLDCLDDVEMIYDEWEKRRKYFDHRIPNFLITTYCKNGFLEKAESLFNKIIESENEPNVSMWSRMAWGYVKNDVMEKAVDAMRKSILRSYRGWTVDTTTLSACLEYLNGKEDLDKAEEIIKLLKEKGHLSKQVYDGLVKNLSKKINI